MTKRLPTVIVSLFLTACAGNVPLTIRQPPADDPGISKVRTDPVLYTGRQVRWGGTISAIENKATETWVEIVGRKLGSYGRPYTSDQSPGRFLVRIEGYLEPEIYTAKREITVYGVVESTITRKIDEFPYTYPLIKASEYYLWPRYTYRNYRYMDVYPYYPDYYSPFLYPGHFYPYAGFGYRYHPYPGFRYRYRYDYFAGPRWYNR